MATPAVASIAITKLAGVYAPAPVVVTLTMRNAATGTLMDVPDAQIRRKDPSGRFATMAITRTATGTYVAGSQASPLYQQRAGDWDFEGRSSSAADLVMPTVETLSVVSNGFPLAAVPAAPTAAGAARVLTHVVTQAEIDAGAAVQVECTFVPTSAVALVAGGSVVSDLVTCDGLNAYVTLAISDGVNPSPFVDGDVVIVTAVQ